MTEKRSGVTALLASRLTFRMIADSRISGQYSMGIAGVRVALRMNAFAGVLGCRERALRARLNRRSSK